VGGSRDAATVLYWFQSGLRNILWAGLLCGMVCADGVAVRAERQGPGQQRKAFLSPRGSQLLPRLELRTTAHLQRTGRRALAGIGQPRLAPA
jgi:hypothetical protein